MSATVVIDEVTPLLARITSAAEAGGLSLVAARAVGSLVREHLFGLDSQRHGFGRHFYAQAARSVHIAKHPRGAAISISQIGFRQRLLGGPIKPGPGKRFLTIPAIPEAVGTRAREWIGLKVARAYNPKLGMLQWALVRVTAAARITLSKRRKITRKDLKTSVIGDPVFWLSRGVKQKADPTVLPYAEQMSGRAIAAIKERLDRLDRRAAEEGGLS